eukprot:scaffold2926_cov247-Pinguiococcus_pyrenoidosus.AAC.3
MKEFEKRLKKSEEYPYRPPRVDASLYQTDVPELLGDAPKPEEAGAPPVWPGTTKAEHVALDRFLSRRMAPLGLSGGAKDRLEEQEPLLDALGEFCPPDFPPISRRTPREKLSLGCEELKVQKGARDCARSRVFGRSSESGERKATMTLRRRGDGDKGRRKGGLHRSVAPESVL